ncbi:MAG: hypothetical protein HZC38_12700 [Chloroflexi bacterium]|nr:hypothetical protein [Chloroflexota bacterium]
MTRLRRRDFLKLCGTSSIGLALAACGVEPTPTVAPTLTNTPAPTATLLPATSIVSTATAIPSQMPTIPLKNLAGVPYPSTDLLIGKNARELAYQNSTNNNGSNFVVAFDKQAPILIGTFANKEQFVWKKATLRTALNALGIKFGVTPDYSDDWDTKAYDAIMGDADIVVPRGATEQGTIDKWGTRLAIG